MSNYEIPSEIIEKCTEADYSFWNQGHVWESEPEGYYKSRYREAIKNTLETFLEEINGV